MEKLKSRISKQYFEALINGNFKTLLSILITENEEIEKRTYLKQYVIDEIKVITAEVMFKHKIKTALEIPAWKRISTGCENIDSILRGGIPINGISEIYGCSGVGKTQLCLQLSLTVQLSNKIDGKSRGTLYICTEDVFPSKRFQELANSFSKKYLLNTNLTNHVYIEHIADIKQLLETLQNRLPTFLLSHDIGLIIIDSIAGVFRSENEKVNYVTRSQEFVFLSTILKNLSDTHQCAVICTNQVTENLKTSEIEPCLGLAWSNNVTCRFNISRLENTSVRTFKVIFAPDLPPSSKPFLISADGISNV